MQSKWLFRVIAFACVWIILIGMGLALISPLLYEGAVISLLAALVGAGAFKYGWLVD